MSVCVSVYREVEERGGEGEGGGRKSSKKWK